MRIQFLTIFSLLIAFTALARDRSYYLDPQAPVPATATAVTPVGSRSGVNIHLLGDFHSLDLARDAGFHFVRMDLLWQNVERNGRYRFGAYDRLLRALEERGMSVLWILDYGHPQHGGDRPHSLADFAAFTDYAEAVAAHFRSRPVRYEIWNEPNNVQFWPPAASPAEYARLLDTAVTAIRRVDPGASISSGGIARLDLPFIAGFLSASNTASSLSAVAFHPYRTEGPESLSPELNRLRVLISHGLAHGAELWETEWGYSSFSSEGNIDVARRRQAVLAVREFLTIWTLDLPLAVWYDLRDDGSDRANPEQNYGLLDAAGNPKAALAALGMVHRIIADSTTTCALPNTPAHLHVLRSETQEDSIFIVWTDTGKNRIRIPVVAFGTASTTDMFGAPLKAARKQRHAESELEVRGADGPLYIRFPRDMY